MKNEHLYLLIGAVVLLALLGDIGLTFAAKPVPDILPFSITSGLGALAMAAKGNNGGDNRDKSGSDGKSDAA